MEFDAQLLVMFLMWAISLCGSGSFIAVLYFGKKRLFDGDYPEMSLVVVLVVCAFVSIFFGFFGGCMTCDILNKHHWI